MTEKTALQRAIEQAQSDVRVSENNLDEARIEAKALRAFADVDVKPGKSALKDAEERIRTWQSELRKDETRLAAMLALQDDCE